MELEESADEYLVEDKPSFDESTPRVMLPSEIILTSHFLKRFEQRVVPYLKKRHNGHILSDDRIAKIVSNELQSINLSELPIIRGQEGIRYYLFPIRFSKTRRGPFYILIPVNEPWKLATIIKREQSRFYYDEEIE